MKYMKEKFLRQNIEKKDFGKAEYVVGMFFILMMAILLHAQLQLTSFRTTSLYLEDALAASNLASALIDLELYGKDRILQIGDAAEAYQIYWDAVRDNLQLDESGNCENIGLISGQVEVADYIVYNVRQDEIRAERVNAGGTIEESWYGTKGEVFAPNGQMVQNTGIYSEITFPVKGFLGITVQAHKGKLVDIVSEEGE